MRAPFAAASLCALVLVPFIAQAQTAEISRIAGIFNVIVGLMLTVALTTYFGGLVLWWTRLGSWPSYRTQAIKVMEWSVATLFTLIVLLGIVQFFQNHQQETLYVISVIVVVGIIWMVLAIAKGSGGKKKESGGKGEE